MTGARGQGPRRYTALELQQLWLGCGQDAGCASWQAVHEEAVRQWRAAGDGHTRPCRGRRSFRRQVRRRDAEPGLAFSRSAA